MNKNSWRRARFEKLDKDYLARLAKMGFNGLSQECGAGHILFKSALEEKPRLFA